MDGAKLRARRQRAALSLRALGELAGVSYVTIQKIEAGETTAHPSTAQKIATALKVEPAELMSEQEDAKP